MQPLKAGIIDIWQADLDLSESQLLLARALLSPNELQRADRMVTEQLRRRRVSSLAILRDILSRYVDIPAKQVTFKAGERGKPYLDVVDCNLQFNMTHSENVALYAVTLNNELGVDVEAMKEGLHQSEIVQKNFSSQEWRQFQQIADEHKTEAFFRGWTRKEAFVKAIGQGLYYPLEDFTVDLMADDSPGLLALKGSKQLAQPWTIHTFRPKNNYIAAIAIQSTVNSWNFLNWQRFAVDN